MLKFIPILVLVLLASVRVFYAGEQLSTRSQDGFTLPMVEQFNNFVITRTRSILPSVHADLLLGMTIGVDEIKKDTSFYDNLVQVGLVHVVVVSGYNVALVITFLSSVFYNKVRSGNRLALFVGVLVYALICGMQPPVIRAALMGYISYLAMTEGRRLECVNLIVVVGSLMVIAYPPYIVSLSFWLSIGATLGLVFFEPLISRIINVLTFGSKVAKLTPAVDLCTSLACQLTVWPLISYFFGRLSLASPVYNMATLWLIPLCTVSGFIFIVFLLLIPPLAPLVAWSVFPFFDVFVRLVKYFSSIDKGSVDFKISLSTFIIYYVFLGLLAWVEYRRSTKLPAMEK
jgi:competence protein ComEC